MGFGGPKDVSATILMDTNRKKCRRRKSSGGEKKNGLGLTDGPFEVHRQDFNLRFTVGRGEGRGGNPRMRVVHSADGMTQRKRNNDASIVNPGRQPNGSYSNTTP